MSQPNLNALRIVAYRLDGLGLNYAFVGGSIANLRENAPRCRWVIDGLTVDIMPTEGAFLGLNTTWFKEALATATVQELGAIRLRLISPVSFLATKYIAFVDRGEGDYSASHDLEDFITVVDGREHIVADVSAAPLELRRYVIKSISSLISQAGFDEALPGYLPSDQASQQRLPTLRRKLREISALT